MDVSRILTDASGWPSRDIHAVNDAVCASIRSTLIDQIWNGAGYPGRLANSVTLNVGQTALDPDIPLTNVAQIDRYSVVVNGVTVQPWLIRPTSANGRLAVIGLGHAPNLNGASHSEKLVQNLLTRGNAIIFVPMPGAAASTANHDALGGDLTGSFHPIRYFVEPVIVSLNQYLHDYSAPSGITAGGISGGGWLTVLLAALDLRIETSVSIAASLPLDLRETAVADINDYGDWEQRLNSLTWDGDDALDYLDLYLMAASGGRTHLQINNQQDTCCFYGTRHTQYASTLTALNAGWTFQLDQLVGHGISDTMLINTVGPLFGTL